MECHLKKSIRIQFDRGIINGNKLGDLDLIAVPLAASFNELQQKGITVFYRTVDQNIIPKSDIIDELAAVENITFIGYPSGIYDTTNKLPIIRQGITAIPIWNKFRDMEVFLIGAGVFLGLGGSSVLIYNQGAYPTKEGIAIGNRLLFVGVILETMVRNDNDTRNYLDLGMVIDSRAMYQEIEKILI